MTEPEPGNLPTGPLLWGQAGVYDAIDDRLAVTALATGITGLVRPPALTPGAGLTVNVGRWHGIADCGDGTLAVVGTRDTQSIEVPAGGGALRTDVLFAEVDPDAGTWTGDLFTEAEVAGRLGVRLGTIGVPAGANGSAQFDLRPGSVALARVRSVRAAAPLNYGGNAQVAFLSLPVQAGRSYVATADVVFNTTGTAQALPQTFAFGGTAGVVAATFRAGAVYTGGSTTVIAQLAAAARWQQVFGIPVNGTPNVIQGGWYAARLFASFDCTADGTLVVNVSTQANVANQGNANVGSQLTVHDITDTGPGATVAPLAPGRGGRVIR